jgi:hypothetical protein
MGAALDDLAVVDDDHHAGIANGGEAVGNDKRGAALEEHFQCPLDQFLGVCVDAGGGLVEDQDAWIGQDCAGKGD